DRGRADRAGDAGECLDADPPALDGRGDESVPALAGRDLHDDATAGGVVVLGVGAQPGGPDLDDGALESVVGDHQVAPAAEHEQRLAGLVGTSYGVDQLVLGGRAHPGTGGTT